MRDNTQEIYVLFEGLFKLFSLEYFGDIDSASIYHKKDPECITQLWNAFLKKELLKIFNTQK
jgi:hypothetical protein